MYGWFELPRRNKRSNIKWPRLGHNRGTALNYGNEILQNNSQSANLPRLPTDCDEEGSCRTVAGPNDIGSHGSGLRVQYYHYFHLGMHLLMN